MFDRLRKRERISATVMSLAENTPGQGICMYSCIQRWTYGKTITSCAWRGGGGRECFIISNYPSWSHKSITISCCFPLHFLRLGETMHLSSPPLSGVLPLIRLFLSRNAADKTSKQFSNKMANFPLDQSSRDGLNRKNTAVAN